ncbi:MAG: hypothetical protein KGO50_14565 [Myxococcales bacterium]|nr:hypothetical protein [Myxococcales bacterium]
MSQEMLAREVLFKYRDEELDLQNRIAALETELGALHSKLSEVRVVRLALEGATGSVAGSRPVSSIPRTAPVVVPNHVAAGSPTADTLEDGDESADAESGAAGRRKGRRQVTGVSRIHDLGIVEAAIELARQRSVREADAGEILEWFKEAGYKGRHGLPTRNSIYVSLNREFQENEGNVRRVSRPSRGRFVFHYDQD